MIFISYSWVDKVFARYMHRILNTAEIEVWIDYQKLNLNRAIEPQLEKAVSQAEGLLLLDSPSSRASSWVRYELSLANRLHKPTAFMEVQKSVPWKQANSELLEQMIGR